MQSAMTPSERISLFIQLGKNIQHIGAEEKEELYFRAAAKNSWFTKESIAQALDGLVLMLEESVMKKWLAPYALKTPVHPKEVGVLMAGNIPAVGFHDLMVVILSGHKAAVKLSSTDEVMMRWLIAKLIEIDPRIGEQISIEDMLKGKDAYIATGNDNSARYFNYYFGKYPHVIRQNRTSVAVLTGDESVGELQELGKDIFQYFGLGCRNVSKVFVKSENQLQTLLGTLEIYAAVGNHHKYHNNYDYNKSIYLVNNEKHLDNGFLLVKESVKLVSPISVLFYEVYSDSDDLASKLENNKAKIQCVVANPEKISGAVAFGNAQQPKPWDYADQVDTLKFLESLI